MAEGMLPMDNKKLFLLVGLIFTVILAFSGGCSSQVSCKSPKAAEGILDLTQRQLDEKVIRLDGQWEFYWNQLLTSQKLKETGVLNAKWIDIPSSWNRYKINDKQLSGDGYATYRLLIKTKEVEKLGIKIPRIFTAYKIWVNDELVATAGKVGKSRERRKILSPQTR